jgi:hypothetical protein
MSEALAAFPADDAANVHRPCHSPQPRFCELERTEAIGEGPQAEQYDKDVTPCVEMDICVA